jgi:predicted nucleic acid-binding protein
VSDFLFDTDTLIRCLRGVPETLELASRLTEDGDLHISVWSQFEILTLTQPREEKRTLEFLAPFISHAINEDIATHAAELLRKQGEITPVLTFGEAMIAATALRHGLTLVSYGSNKLMSLEGLKLLELGKVAKSY